MKKLFIAIGLILCIGTGTAQAKSVYYNTNSQIYHKHSCEWAEKCTKNCKTMDHKEAKRRGGRPCRVCGG